VIADVSRKGGNRGAGFDAHELGVFGSDVNRLTLQ